MVDFHIDTRGLSEEFSLTEADVDNLVTYCVEEVTSEVYQHWRGEAKENLGSARSQYINALSIEKVSKHTRAVFLNPAVWLPNAIENGAPAFDMKPGFLASSKVKYTKKGEPYLTIPFRFATPGSIGENEAFAGVMPAVIQKAVVETERQSGKESSPLKLGSIPTRFQMPESPRLRQAMKSVGYEKVEQATKMTSMYQGLQRSSKGSGYVNFRRVSLASDSGRFQHPGITPRGFANKAESRVSSIIPNIVDYAIDNFLASR